MSVGGDFGKRKHPQLRELVRKMVVDAYLAGNSDGWWEARETEGDNRKLPKSERSKTPVADEYVRGAGQGVGSEWRRVAERLADGSIDATLRLFRGGGSWVFPLTELLSDLDVFAVDVFLAGESRGWDVAEAVECDNRDEDTGRFVATPVADAYAERFSGTRAERAAYRAESLRCLGKWLVLYRG